MTVWKWLLATITRMRASLVASRPIPVDPPSPPKSYRPLERVELRRGVLLTLFDDFARHRETARGDEEIGWAILGIRHERHAEIVAALPAGAQRSASLTHIQFHSEAQAVATRMLRQRDKRLSLLGVVHTHPGSLRHPSGGDYRGDIRFITRLRGRQGVFAIGTADDHGPPEIAATDEHRLSRGPLGFSWYTLAEADDTYQRQSVEIIAGDDLAGGLAASWPILETHAAALEALCQTLANVELGAGGDGTISLAVPLPANRGQLRVLLAHDAPRYYVEVENAALSVDAAAANVEHGVLAILAELAGRKSCRQ